MNTFQRTGFARVITCIPVLVFGILCSARTAQAQSSEATVEQYLQEINQLAHEALQASRAAEEAQTVAEVKALADEVYRTVWGVSSGIAGEGTWGAVQVRGWKTRWQTTPAAFDSAFAARLGTEPPAVTDPGKLGIMGRARYVRKQLQAVVDSETASAEEKLTARHIIASLNNVIGWMIMDNGVTKGELQPRVDLTRLWDSRSEFWLSTSDTGWLHQAASQALNILKVDYSGDVEAARQHAAAMTELIEKYINGVDVDGNGTVEPVKMEGGLQAALNQAEEAGYL